MRGQARASGTYAARVMAGEADELALGFNFELFTHTTRFFDQKVVLLAGHPYTLAASSPWPGHSFLDCFIVYQCTSVPVYRYTHTACSSLALHSFSFQLNFRSAAPFRP